MPDDYALKILVVEDNDALREATLSYLQSRGHYVRGVVMAEELQDVAGAFVPDVYVIDLNLPDEDGLTLVKRLRSVQPTVGIVITTARAQIGDRVLGYESGADLYMTKPVAPNELLAGIVALSKRVRASAPVGGNLRFDAGRAMLSGSRGTVELTHSETVTLVAFARAAGNTLERWQLAELIGSASDPVAAAALEMRVARLRKKLAAAGAAPPYIKAQHKMGYTLCSVVTID
jgi:DNA-binding response OmpR family regulator